jgi:hypothetical protein
MDYSQQGLSIGFDFSFVISAPEKFVYGFEESNDNVSWWPVAAESILPTWNQQHDNILYNPVGSYIQTAGFIGDANYWRATLIGHNLGTTRVVGISPVVITNIIPFTGWSTKSFPVNNTRP